MCRQKALNSFTDLLNITTATITMHPRSPYSSSLSFALLAERYPDLKQHLIHNGKTIDFQNPEAVRCLSAALLKVDWNLAVDFGGKIVPGVPSRLNYVLFIQDLLDSTIPRGAATATGSNQVVVGLDIGTGASAIYPLLAVRSRPGWKMIATELDPTSLPTAVANVARNGLAESITVIPAEMDESLQKARVLPFKFLHEWASSTGNQRAATVDFTMCNPPFFDSEPSADDGNAVVKTLAAAAVCEATPFELKTTGGEVSFVTQMINESIQLCSLGSSVRVRWFTALLGHKASIEPLVHFLRAAHIGNYAISRLTTGQNWKGTVRWVLAWSFELVRPPVEIARGGGSTMRPFWPEVGELAIPNVKVQRIIEIIDSLKSKHIETISTKGEVLGRCSHDVWSRKARRAMQRGEVVGGGQGVGVGWRLVKDDDCKGVKVIWREGHDRVLFESWSGWLKREATRSNSTEAWNSAI